MGVEGLQNLRLEFYDLFKRVLPSQQNVVVRKIAIEGFIGCVMKTPVDTGRARANWSVTVGQMKTTSSESFDKAPIGAAPADLATAVSAANGSLLGQTIYVTNALPYILPLEEGHSKQGSHMVERTVNELKQHYGI